MWRSAVVSSAHGDGERESNVRVSAPKTGPKVVPRRKLCSHSTIIDRRAMLALTMLVLATPASIITWQFVEQEANDRVVFRSGVQQLADSYAADLRRQVQSSVSASWSLGAVVAVLPANYSLSSSDFSDVARNIEQSYSGITNLQYAPDSVITYIHPLRASDKRVIGRNLLIDPLRRAPALATIKAYPTRRVTVEGPLVLLQGDVAIVARHPVFSANAPEFIATREWTDGASGVTYTADCATAALAQANCRFAGPPNSAGEPTFFWGFVTVLCTVTDLIGELLRPLEGNSSQRGAGTSSASSSLADGFSYQLRAYPAHPSLAAVAGVFAQSSNLTQANESLADAVVALVLLPELDIRWELRLRPAGGWPRTSEQFAFKLALIVCFSAAAVLLMATLLVNAMRAAARARADARSEVHEAKAEAAKGARSLLIRSVLHDLRSPLLSISVVCAELAAKPRADPHEGRLVSTLSMCARFMESLLSDMLDWERIEAGRMDIAMEAFDPRDVLRAAVATFAHTGLAKGVEVLASVVTALPPMEGARGSGASFGEPGGSELVHALTVAPPAQDAVEPSALPLLWGDVRRLQQCVNNGCSNAIKFSPPGSRVLLQLQLLPWAPAPASARLAPSETSACSAARSAAHASATAGRSSGGLSRLWPRLPAAAGARAGRAGRTTAQRLGLGLGSLRSRKPVAAHTMRRAQVQVQPEEDEAAAAAAAGAEEAQGAGGVEAGLAQPQPQPQPTPTPTVRQFVLVVRVTDQGSGLSPEDLAHLRASLQLPSAEAQADAEDADADAANDPLVAAVAGGFTQVGAGRAQGNRATGLGLLITRQIAQRHRGSLRIESDGLGRGTRFELRVRLGTPPPAEPQPEPAPPVACARQAATSGAGSSSSWTLGPHSFLDRLSTALRGGGSPCAAASAQPAPGAAHRAGALFSRSPRSSPPTGSRLSVPGQGPPRPAPTPSPAPAALPRVAATGEAAAAALAATPAASAPAASAAARAGGGGGPRELLLLHVDDDPFVRFTLPLQAFAPIGQAFVQAADGLEALEVVAKLGEGPTPRAFDVIVVDNQMPRMNGTELTRQLRLQGFEGMIIGMTGDMQGCVDRVEFEAAGLDACLDKHLDGVKELSKLVAQRREELVAQASE